MHPGGRREQTLDETGAVLRQVLLELDDLGPLRRHTRAGEGHPTGRPDATPSPLLATRDS
jgi:hypothetical protein